MYIRQTHKQLLATVVVMRDAHYHLLENAYYEKSASVFLIQGTNLRYEVVHTVFDGNLGVIITIGCVTYDRLRDSPPHGNRKHNTSVVFDC